MTTPRIFGKLYRKDLRGIVISRRMELKSFELRYPDEELVERFLDAWPPRFEMYTTLMREYPKFYEMTDEEAIGKVQAHDMNLKREESSGRPQIQDPSMNHGMSSTTKSSGSGIALFSGNSHEEETVKTCAGHACYATSESGSRSHQQHPSRNPPATTSANQSAIAKIAEDHVTLFSSCMLAYENFIGGKLTNPETIEEDFNQVDPDDMEDMDIQWNMATILRGAKRFLNRTGRKFIGGHSNAKVGFDKSKAKCYKCLNYGHFAHECQKDRAPASGFTRPSQGNSHGYNNSNNHNHSQSGTSNALVAQQDESFDWGVHLEDAIIAQTQKKEASMADLEESTTAATEEEKEAEEKEASVADKEESTTDVALMAIGEATRGGLEKRNNEINKLQNEILHLKCSNEKLKNSRFVVEHYESVVRQMNGLGLGTNAIPPPVSGKFVNSLIDIDLTCLDESSNKDDSPKKDESSSKANSTSSEEFVTASEDG
ncbi:hypothetical protein L1987_70991 [Smallanthus sonchifolius]|uniref:Uncharacterized protein n=1 Tax=Smallanthus sonchifolius TaxID=185202 RepID=A0ACB9AVH5_9ASTR|nr:hypothetical protein L1987_70991 [Smallanthus sonchifolius]